MARIDTQRCRRVRLGPRESRLSLSLSLSLHEPGDEILAVDTYEAVRVVRRGDWVFKFLRAHDAFGPQSPAARLRQIRVRVRESWQHSELNPLYYDEPANCLVSRFVDGPWAGTRQSNALLRAMIASGRGYLLDLAPQNLRMTPAGLVAIDFAIDESHADWLTQTPSFCS